LIDRRELLAKARERRLPLAMVEKDYVLGWALCGLMRIGSLVFKGGTALAKVYFPETWRLSEDLDFVVAVPDWEALGDRMRQALELTGEHSGLALRVRSQHSNPNYLQLKVQYSGPLGKNWLKVDVTSEHAIDQVEQRPLVQSYSDYPDFTVRVESLEEILAQKLRALVERKKVRDYYDVWKLTQMEIDRDKVLHLFRHKLRVKDIRWTGMAAVFPVDLPGILEGYWSNELGRLVWPVPDMSTVLAELQRSLRWLESSLE